MHAALDPALQERYPLEAFSELHAAFAEMARVTDLERDARRAGDDRPAGRAAPRRLPGADRRRRSPRRIPPPAPTPSATPAPTAPPFDPERPLDGPVPALSVPMALAVASERFGELDLERALTLVHGPDGWLVRWSPELLFPELGPDGTLRLDRELGARGRIVGAGDVVWAENRDDGARVYPQEALAGQVIGYVSEVTAEDLATLEAEGYLAGDVVGRSGLESGAEALLRGTPGWSLVAVPAEGEPSVAARDRDGPRSRCRDHDPARPSSSPRRTPCRPMPQGATAVVDPKQRRRLGARQPAGVQPELDDDRHDASAACR